MKKSVETDKSILDRCKLISSDPPTYKTEHYIVEADKEYICKAVAWAKCIESNVYPTMLEMMGHTPTVNLHALHFVDHRLQLRKGKSTGAWFEGIKRFRDTQYVISRIKIFNGKLEEPPADLLEGNITHETIHGLLDEAKNSRNRTSKWKPIWQCELLDCIFEMELSLRLGNEKKSEKRYNQCVKKGGNYAVFAQFWKRRKWDPFQSLIIRMNDDHNFPPTLLDRNNFAYYMSLFAKENVSDFFEKHGWNIDDKTKEKITEDLQREG